MNRYLCFVLQNASMSMQNWFVLCSIESKTSFIALCLVHLLCKWCWNCTKRHSLHIFENLVETERHLMHNCASDSLLVWMCCSQIETSLNALAPKQHEKHFIEEIQFSYTNLNNLNLTFTKPWIRSALSVFQAQLTDKTFEKTSNVNVPVFCRVSPLT